MQIRLDVQKGNGLQRTAIDLSKTRQVVRHPELFGMNYVGLPVLHEFIDPFRQPGRSTPLMVSAQRRVKRSHRKERASAGKELAVVVGRGFIHVAPSFLKRVDSEHSYLVAVLPDGRPKMEVSHSRTADRRIRK